MLCSRFRDDFTIISTDFGPTQSWVEKAEHQAFKGGGSDTFNCSDGYRGEPFKDGENHEKSI